MKRARSRVFEIALGKTVLAVAAALSVSQVALAACPPPERPPVRDAFHFCFDASRVKPQPILGVDAGPFLIVEVELNGHKLPALLDTGAAGSLVDSTAARDIGLKPTGSIEITALDARKTNALKAPIDELVIGGFIREGGIVGIADLSAIRSVVRQPFAMVVGAEVLAQVALAVDRDTQSVIVLPANAQVNGPGSKAPLSLQQPDNMFMTEMSIQGRVVRVSLDTGADDELILPQRSWAAIVAPNARSTTMVGVGAAGLFVKPMVRLDGVKIGEEQVGDAIATEVTGTASSGGSDGILGMGILSRYNLFLNPQQGVFVLSPLRKPASPRRETMLGILGPPTDEGITVMHVMANSPAQAVGLKAGDRICSVDGETVRAAWEGTPKNDWMTGPEGKTVVLGRCGGAELLVKLRRFY